MAVEGIARDVTESVRLQSDLKKSNEKLQLLLGITRHDVLDKLTFLKRGIDLCLNSDDIDREVHVEKALDCIGEMARAMTLICQYESLEVQKMKWHNLSEIIKENCDGISSSKIQKQDYELYGDRMLGKAFSSLKDNSPCPAVNADFLNIRCEEKDGTLEISWINGVPGVTADQKEGIFSNGLECTEVSGLFLSRGILAINEMGIKEIGTLGEGAHYIISVPEGRFRSSNR